MRLLIQLLPVFAALAILRAEDAITFFPVSEQGGDSTISNFEEEWYSKHLRAMHERSLFAEKKTKDLEVYRFTILPTWGAPRSASIIKEDGKAFIRFVRLDGSGGYEPGKLVEQTKRELSAEELKKFSALYESINFPDQKTQDPFIGRDGSEWILESVKDGKYHIVVRWTANKYDPKKRGTEKFVALCQWMLSDGSNNNKQNKAEEPTPNPPSD